MQSPPPNPNSHSPTPNPHRLHLNRKDILVHQPPHQFHLPHVNWDLAVVGVFHDMAPPPISLVFSIINSHWTTRAHIHIFRTGPYYIFECQSPRDREAILLLHTTIIDGKPITFRASSETQIPTSINFDTAQIWVRIHDLPWKFLNTEWTIRILSHVGYVDVIDDNGQGLPHQPYLRAQLIINLSQPLIPGCFLPLDDNCATWVYFRYEGIYKFCKECGYVGHHTGRCNLSAYDAQRIIRRRLHEFEDHGMTILQAPSEIPLYRNMIRGLSDRFINRNPREDLVQTIRPFDRRDDLYRFPNQDPDGTEPSECSSDPFMEPVSPFVGEFLRTLTRIRIPIPTHLLTSPIPPSRKHTLRSPRKPGNHATFG